ncbi:MAG: malonate--CoA ligase [Hyphomicrobiales bacterium]
MTNHNLYALFETRFANAQDKVALRPYEGGAEVSYKELACQAAKYANALVASGVKPGDRVTVQINKSVANVFLYLAVTKAGAVYQPLNTAYTPAEVDYFVSDAKPSLIVCDPGNREALSKIAKAHGVAAVHTLDGAGAGSLADLAAEQSENHETVHRDADDLAGLLYTSGTTGRSKGAMLSHENLSSNAITLHKLWQFEEGDVLIHALPIFHVHGLYVALNTAFLNASEMIWMAKFDADAVIDALPNGTVLMGVPTFYTRLLAEERFTKELVSNMRLFISGSAPLLAETHTAFEERTGLRILERYGMTEAGMITSNPYDGERIAGTVGYALPDVSVRVADEGGNALSAGEIGVLEAKGPNIFQGYWQMPEKTAEEFRDDGYFITGDIAKQDDDGRITIVGRAKDMIISGGFNVYPKEIESEIDDMPGIGESAVVGVPHPDFGEGVIAVVTAEGVAPSEQEIISSLSESLAKFKVPKHVYFVDVLPRNAMGKVQKAELRETYKETFA